MKRYVSDFVRERDWERFHNPKDLAVSLSIECSELLEIFQWKGQEDVDVKDEKVANKMKEELADIVIYAISMANATSIDISDAVSEKIRTNESKYPAEEWKGKAWL
ncbi:MAG: nucleotide pyrophosphohydrolase [Methanobacteriota archaeon]|nr:MAG: nucleotide pyrophosphohydrolase [Euryarchaeota archaeon]